MLSVLAAALVGIGLRADSVEGLWTTDYGPLRILRSGTGYEGFYGSGTVQGRGESNEWWAFAYTEGDTSGVARFKVEGDHLVGRWRPDGRPHWGDWNGTRMEPGNRKFLVVLEAPWENGFVESPCEYTPAG